VLVPTGVLALNGSLGHAGGRNGSLLATSLVPFAVVRQ